MSNLENDTRYRAASLAVHLARFYPLASAHRLAMVVHDMQNATRAAKAWEVRRCSEGMTEAQEARGRARQQKAQDNLNISLTECNQADGAAHATVSLGGDPRGCCGTLTIPGQRGDGWGDGFAIY